MHGIYVTTMHDASLAARRPQAQAEGASWLQQPAPSRQIHSAQTFYQILEADLVNLE